jgi:acyl-coenzyme A synthetase/AMP-(fatty) acid ligase/acyl carrier protein
MVSHAGLENLARAQAELLGVGPGARVLQFSSPSFDASVFELAMALFSGATLVQAEEDEVLLGDALLDFAARTAVTHAVLPPSLLAALPEPRLPDLHTLIVAGEACPPEVVRRWAPGRRFVNAYGPTEATIWSTAAELAPGDEVSIGGPIRGVQAHVLDLHGQPLPPGVVGELALGGPGIARGYLNAPAQTAERFTPDFLGGRPGARLYRTGDLAYRTEADELNFCGRADHQIKLRGYRIELGEIEAVLREHPDVSAAAAVLVPGSGSGSGSLVAFAVAAHGSDLDGEALKSWAAERLPEYSVPARTVVVAEMPLTHAGKVDRAALVERADKSLEAGAGEVASAPSSQLEALLAHFWGQFTGLAVVDVRADLFDQRGDSLRMMELVGRVGQDLGVTVPIQEVFDSPTLTALAAYVLRAAESAEQLERTAGELLKRAGVGEGVGADV